jgi:hypothetical protein
MSTADHGGNNEHPNRPPAKFRKRRSQIKRQSVSPASAEVDKQAIDHTSLKGQSAPSLPRDWTSDDEKQHLSELRELRAELSEESRVLWLPHLRPIVKSGDQAICLCQFLYWFDQGRDGKTRARLRIKGGKELWMAKTVAEFGEEVGLSVRQARSALEALVSLGLIEKRAKSFNARKTTYWRVVPGAIAKALRSI